MVWEGRMEKGERERGKGQEGTRMRFALDGRRGDGVWLHRQRYWYRSNEGSGLEGSVFVCIDYCGTIFCSEMRYE